MISLFIFFIDYLSYRESSSDSTVMNMKIMVAYIQFNYNFMQHAVFPHDFPKFSQNFLYI